MGRFVLEYRVPWADVDAAGVVYFVNYVSYFELAEVEWVRSLGFGYGELLDRLDIWMPRVAIHCNYHRPARLDDRLAIEMNLERMGNTSFTLGFDLYHLPNREHVADGYSVITTVSRKRFEPVRVPDDLREILLRLQNSSEGRSQQ